MSSLYSRFSELTSLNHSASHSANVRRLVFVKHIQSTIPYVLPFMQFVQFVAQHRESRSDDGIDFTNAAFILTFQILALATPGSLRGRCVHPTGKRKQNAALVLPLCQDLSSDISNLHQGLARMYAGVHDHLPHLFDARIRHLGAN